MNRSQPGTILVLGGTGQIGRQVVARAIDAGWRVVGLSRGTRVTDHAQLDWLTCDLDQGPIEFLRARADVAVHATGLWLLPDQLPVIAAAGVRRLVAFSTSSVISKADTGSAYEQAQVKAIRDAEDRVRAFCAAQDIGLTVFRPTLIYGTGQDQNVSAAARLILRLGWFPLAGAGAGLRQPVHADDLAAAALGAIECQAAVGRDYFLAGGETLTYRDMIGRIFDALGKPRRFLHLPGLALLVGLYGRMAGKPVITADSVRRMNNDLTFDDGPARRDFGYAPRRFLPGGRADLGLPPDP